MSKIIKTSMLKSYMVKFGIRIFIFLFIAVLYVANKPLMYQLMTQPIWKGITPIHVLWMVFMVMMLGHIFPTERLSMAMGKADEKHYYENKNYSQLELLQFVQNQNIKAWTVMLIWLVFNAIFILYLCGIMDEADLLMLTVFYFCATISVFYYIAVPVCDYENRCCVNCRIYDWGHFMMFTPMLFIQNFYSWSLFFTSCIVLIKWEITYAKHPERFWYGSNNSLQCANCKDKICQLKKRIRKS